jgi:hypothetical protein
MRMKIRGFCRALAAFAAILAVGLPAAEVAHSQSSPQRPEEIYWYYDAETALQMAAKTGRPIVILKVRADIGQDVKT